METLGWIIWVIGLLLLLRSFTKLVRNEKRRVSRALFCICTATGLALTALTPLSKFHLLWILPLQILLGIVGFALLAGGALAYHKAAARKPKQTTLPAGRVPPFGELKWEGYDSWEGKTRLPAWAGFQSRGGAYTSEDSEEPSDGSTTVHVTPPEGIEDPDLAPTASQCRALEFQIQNGDQVVASVLAAVLPYYQDLKKDWDADEEEMPTVSDAEQFRKMMGLGVVHVLADERDGLAYVGLEFGCDWDEEHGFGVVLHGAQVVNIGQASDAFSWAPEGEAPAAAKEG